MNVTKFLDQADSVRVGIVESDHLLPLQLGERYSSLAELLATENPIATIQSLDTDAPVPIDDSIRWLPPIDNQEVWAAGVTYKRSQTARMEESEAAASCYDRVYQAERPEQRAFVEGIVGLTRALDKSRPIVGNDGWEFSAGDLWTLHVYEENMNLITEIEDLKNRSFIQILFDSIN